MEYSIKPKSLGERRIIHYPQKRIIGLYEKRWILSPAYDLTYSNSIGGEHATTVNGNGADPGMDDLLSVAKKIGLGMTKARKTAAEIQECVQERLRDYLSDRIE